MIFSSVVNGNTVILQEQSAINYAYKDAIADDLFYTGIPYDFVFDIQFNSVHVGILYVSQMQEGALFINWVEIMTPFRGKGILRHVFSLLTSGFKTNEIDLECEEKYLEKYKKLGFTVLSFDNFSEMYRLCLSIESATEQNGGQM